MEDTPQIQAPRPKRPQLLSILCILTFIGSGISAFFFLMVSLNFEASMTLMETVYADMPEAAFMLEAPREFFVISFVLSAFSVLGAVFMWQLRKTGFHIYTSAQLIYLVVPLIYSGGETNPMLNIIITALFVYLYARNLPQMR